jgi:predicted ATPase/DNA-binding CsgD family transcriptional regulator
MTPDGVGRQRPRRSAVSATGGRSGTPEARCREVRLPHETTSFVGRRQAVAAVKRTLSAARLVTLTGVGGVGKSRLALRVAKDMRRAFPGGVWLVELATVRDSSLVAHAVAAAVGLSDRSGRDLQTTLADYLAGRQSLLLLDNCEHVLAGCCRLANKLLSAASGLRILATSREPLRSTAEHVWPVPPLPVSAVDGPDAGTSPHQSEALMLFEERAAALIPGFTLNDGTGTAAARLCQRLDGVPLAIELAVMHLRALSVKQVLDRLDDNMFRLLSTGYRGASPRHQTLRATMDWSFEPCSTVEHALWARCSVFAGEFDFQAAESVCSGEGLTEFDVFKGVAGLMDKSVLIRAEGEGSGPARYRMLESIREYGRQRLAEAGGQAMLRRRHRDYYLGVAEEIDADSFGPRQDELVRRLHAEGANFAAALDYCRTEPGEVRTGLRMAAALWFYWIVCGRLEEGRHWLNQALDLETAPSPERVTALWLAGWIAHLQGDSAASLTLHSQSRDLAWRMKDNDILTRAAFLGDEQLWADNLLRALRDLDQMRQRRHTKEYWAAPAMLTFALGAPAAGLPGEIDSAMEVYSECRALCEPMGERWALSWMAWNIGVTWWAVGNSEKAYEHARDALRSKSELNDQVGTPYCVELLSWVAACLGDPRRSVVLFGAAEKMWEPIGGPLLGSEILLKWSGESQARSREALGDRAYDDARQEGARLSRDEIIAYALDVRTSSSGATSQPSAAKNEPRLTKRERQIAELVARGLSNKDIAAELVISQRTAEGHVERIRTKLGFNSRTRIAAWILQQENSDTGTAFQWSV